MSASKIGLSSYEDPYEDLRIDYPVEEELLAAAEYALRWFEQWEEHANHEVNDFGREHAVMKKLGRAIGFAREEPSAGS